MDDGAELRGLAAPGGFASATERGGGEEENGVLTSNGGGL